MKHHIQWLALPGCPENQLQPNNPDKAGKNDAGLDLRVAEDTIVLPFHSLGFSYDWIKPAEKWEGEIFSPFSPDLVIHEREGEKWIARKRYQFPLIKTGVKLIHPEQETLSWVALYLRSSMSKYGLALANQVGVIDMSYTGEVLIAAYSRTGPIPISRGEPIAQLVPHPQFQLTLEKVSSDPRTEERGGFGSTS
jgi:dUTPase